MTRRLGVITAAGVATLVAVTVAGAVPSVALTPDQRFVAELAGARASAKSAVRRLKPGALTLDNVQRATADLIAAQKHMRAASTLLPDTVGAMENEDILTGLRLATSQTGQAAVDVKRASYDAARVKIAVANDATSSALAAFGVPLAREFQAFAVYRDLSNIYGFEEYLGLTAKVSAPIAKIVIGIAGRETANVSEPGGTKRGLPSLQIAKLALYTIQEPSGAFSSGWCKIVNGILVCDLDPTMAANETFAVAFGPLVPAGTKFLVKFWSTDGKRSYAIMTTR